MLRNEPTQIALQDLHELGWKKDGEDYVGEYVTELGRWSGIARYEKGVWQYYILDCPRQVLIGRHSGCFRSRPSSGGKTVHWIHFSSPSDSVHGGITAISMVLLEAMIESPANHSDA